MGLFILAGFLLELTVSDASTEVHVARLLSWYPAVGTAAAVVLFRWFPDKYRVALICCLLVATAIWEQFLVSRVVLKLEASAGGVLAFAAGQLVGALLLAGMVLLTEVAARKLGLVPDRREMQQAP